MNEIDHLMKMEKMNDLAGAVASLRMKTDIKLAIKILKQTMETSKEISLLASKY